MISIIIPNFNGKVLLQDNLPYVVAAFKNKKNSIKEIIVVDDGSTDESVNFLRKNYPTIRLIVHKKNRGFSAAINTGVRSCKGKLLCLLNNDVKPIINFLVGMEKLFEDINLFAVSLHEKGYGPSRGVFDKGYINHAPKKESHGIENTFWVSGGSGVFSRKLWLKVGWLDEDLFSPFYWEDVDICYRALKRGYKLLWKHDAIVFHEHESTTKNINKKYRQRIQERNHLLFIWKNLTSDGLIKKHIWGLLRRTLSGPGYIRIIFMAVMKIKLVFKKRKREKKETNVSDETIFASF